MNRYYGSNLGRFLTPDPFGGSPSLSRPNSWNRYAYVEGDPVNSNDPTGLFLSGLSTDFVGNGSISNPMLELFLQRAWYASLDAYRLWGIAAWIPEPQGGGGPFFPQQTWLDALDVLINARPSDPNVPDKCAQDLALLDVTAQQLIDGIRGMSWIDGTRSDDMVTYKGERRAVSSIFRELGGDVTALTSGNTTYWNPSNVRGTNQRHAGTSQIQGTQFHEGLHGLGRSDRQMQLALFGKEDPSDTNNISRRLAEDCFPIP